jgi:hypothetical protein
MCEPTTIAAAAMAIASVGSAVSGYQAADAQADLQEKMYEQNKRNSYAAMRQGYITTQQRQAQEMEAASQQIQNRRLEAARQTATSNVAAGEAGVSGFSVERIMRDIGAMGGRDVSTIQQNRDWNVSQLQNQMLGLKNKTKSRIQSRSPGIDPSPVPYLLQGVKGVAGAYGTYSSGQS